MKYVFFFLLVLNGSMLAAQSNADSETATLKSRNGSMFFFKLGFITGGVHFDHSNSPLIFQSRPGMGADLLFGFNVHKRLAIGLGGNFVHFSLNKKMLDASVTAHFSEYGYRTINTSATGGRMNKSSGYVYVSYWLQKPKFILEMYTKLCLSYSSIQLHNIIYRHKNLSQISEYYLLNKPHAFAAFLPMIGFCGNQQISSIASLYLSAEYGYSFNNFKTMDVNHYSSLGTEDIYRLNTPQASHIFQAGIGLMLRPFNK